MSYTTKNDATAEIQTFATGLQGLSDTSFQIGNKTVPKTVLLQACTDYLAAVAATALAKGQVKSCLETEQQTKATVVAFRDLMKSLLESRYTKSSSELLKFGFTPTKPHKITVEAKAAGIQQGKQTRTARHTMGKKQRLAVKPVATAATNTKP